VHGRRQASRIWMEEPFIWLGARQREALLLYVMYSYTVSGGAVDGSELVERAHNHATGLPSL
jgi:hypothetical protein